MKCINLNPLSKFESIPFHIYGEVIGDHLRVQSGDHLSSGDHLRVCTELNFLNLAQILSSLLIY